MAGAAVNTGSDVEAELVSNHKRTFQVVGTVSHPSAVERPHVVEQYTVRTCCLRCESHSLLFKLYIQDQLFVAFFQASGPR